jgi:hypothetical protein
VSWGRLRDLDDWRTRLTLEGRVEVSVRRWQAVLLGLFGVPMGMVMGGGAVLAGIGGGVSVVVVLVAACGAILGLSGVLLLVRACRPGPVLVVRRDGLDLPRLALRVPWPALRAVEVRHTRYNRFVQLRLDPGFRDHWLRHGGVGWFTRLRHGGPLLTLPTPLTADADHLAEFVNELAEQARR